MSDKINRILYDIGTQVQNNELSNSDLLSIIDLCAGYLNLKTIPDYSKIEGISYNGTLNRIKLNKVEVTELFGVKLIIDNK